MKRRAKAARDSRPRAASSSTVHGCAGSPWTARSAADTVVPAAADGCVPTDLLAHLLAERYGPLGTLTSTRTGSGSER
ncbi:hypothetical protein [Actinomadura sp. 21ATH]|uniref:hypothetical protein n=1 Tax=Actinomadura sp. 21ATH TaxID=1735444 RepID=UPI0035BFF232